MSRRLVELAAALVASLSAATAWAQLNPSAEREYEKFERLPPHRAFAVAGDGRVYYWSRVSGADPGAAAASALKSCSDAHNQNCTLYAVNNVVLQGRPWQQVFPPLLPDIGRLRPETYWLNRGPQAAAGLIVWSHGYRSGTDSSLNAPQGEVTNFTRSGYDLYRFDRPVIVDWHRDAMDLANAVRTARAMGYRRIVLSGQSAGAWVSLAALDRGAPVDGVISISAAHHGEVKNMHDPAFARSEWRKLMEAIKPGPRLVLVQFAGDTFDVGGRMKIAYDVLTQAGVQAIIINHPQGFEGHYAGAVPAFPLKFGACIDAFIETGSRQAPCI